MNFWTYEEGCHRSPYAQTTLYYEYITNHSLTGRNIYMIGKCICPAINELASIHPDDLWTQCPCYQTFYSLNMSKPPLLHHRQLHL